MKKLRLAPRKTAFVKVSGDVCENAVFMEFLRSRAQTHYLVVCVGGGTQISEALREHGVVSAPDGPLGRELTTFTQRQIARDALEVNQATLQDALAARGISATVVIPVLDIGGVLCHVNGDVYLRSAYNGFDDLFVATLVDRVEVKQQAFQDLPKVRIIGF